MWASGHNSIQKILMAGANVGAKYVIRGAVGNVVPGSPCSTGGKGSRCELFKQLFDFRQRRYHSELCILHSDENKCGVPYSGGRLFDLGGTKSGGWTDTTVCCGVPPVSMGFVVCLRGFLFHAAQLRSTKQKVDSMKTIRRGTPAAGISRARQAMAAESVAVLNRKRETRKSVRLESIVLRPSWVATACHFYAVPENTPIKSNRVVRLRI